MGHRANFVIIRDGTTKLFGDSWAALGCVYSLADGPEVAASVWADPVFETDGFYEWAFAEGGYLIDFDRKTAIAFGYTMPDEEMANADGEIDPSIPIMNRAFENSKLDFLKFVSGKWPGWTLIWDDRGVDRFSMYLEENGIEGIPLIEPSHPDNLEPPVELSG